jgi:predicted MFS family arabinose efflux permease
VTGVPPRAAPASWIAIGSLAISTFAMVTTELLPIGLVPDIARGTHITDGQAGMMVTMTGFLSALAAPLSVAVAGNIDRKRVLIALLALLVASNVIVGTAGGLLQLLLGRVLLGFAVGSFWTIAGSLGPRLREGAAGVRASAVILSGISVGTVAGVPAGALVGSIFGWRSAFFAGSGLPALAMVALIVLLPAIPPEHRGSLSDFPTILRERRAQIGLIAAVFAFGGQFTAYTNIAPFLERDGVDGSALSAILLASGAAGFIGNLAGARLSERDVRGSVLAMAALLGLSILLLDILGRNAVIAVVLVMAWGVRLRHASHLDAELDVRRRSRAPGRHPSLVRLRRAARHRRRCARRRRHRRPPRPRCRVARRQRRSHHDGADHRRLARHEAAHRRRRLLHRESLSTRPVIVKAFLLPHPRRRLRCRHTPTFGQDIQDLSQNHGTGPRSARSSGPQAALELLYRVSVMRRTHRTIKRMIGCDCLDHGVDHLLRFQLVGQDVGNIRRR